MNFCFPSSLSPWPFRFMRNPRWIWSRRGRLSAVPQAAPRWVWGVLCSACRGRSAFPQGGTSHLAIMPAAGFPSIPRYSHHRCHHHHHHHFPLWIVWTTSRPASVIHWCWLFPPHNFPWEVSQPNPAHQMFRIDISDWGKEGACFDNSCLNSGPLDYWWNSSSSETESDFVLFSHLSKIKLLDSSRTHSFSTYLYERKLACCAGLTLFWPPVVPIKWARCEV